MVWITEWVSISSYMQPLAFSSNPCFSDSLSVLFLVPLNFGHYMDPEGCPPVFLSMWFFFFFCFDPQCSQSIPSLFHSSHSLERESDCLVLIEYLVMLCHSSEVTDYPLCVATIRGPGHLAKKIKDVRLYLCPECEQDSSF